MKNCIFFVLLSPCLQKKCFKRGWLFLSARVCITSKTTRKLKYRRVFPSQKMKKKNHIRGESSVQLRRALCFFLPGNENKASGRIKREREKTRWKTFSVSPTKTYPRVILRFVQRMFQCPTKRIYWESHMYCITKKRRKGICQHHCKIVLNIRTWCVDFCALICELKKQRRRKN